MIPFMYAGAGRTGKTTLVEHLVKYLMAEQCSVKVFKSTTRATFQRLGFKTEGDAMENLSTPDFLALQAEVRKDFRTAIEREAMDTANQGLSFLLCDRSPYDYISYILSLKSADGKFTIAEIHDLWNWADGIMRFFAKNSRVGHTVIHYTRFPQPWHTDEEGSSDGYRADKTGKNYAWSTQCLGELIQAGQRGAPISMSTRGSLFDEKAPPEFTAREAASQLLRMRKQVG